MFPRFNQLMLEVQLNFILHGCSSIDIGSTPSQFEVSIGILQMLCSIHVDTTYIYIHALIYSYILRSPLLMMI